MDIQAAAPVTLCLSKATLAAGTTTTISTTGTTTYMINSLFYTKTAITNGTTPTTDWVTGAAFNQVLANKGSIYMVGFDSGGSVRAIQGSITDLDASGAFVLAPQFGGSGPQGSGTTDNDFCPIGYIVIKAGATASATSGWIFGSSNMSGVTGITYTFVDCGSFPSRPRVS